MSRLLYLTAVLVSITCCSLLSPATGENIKGNSIQLVIEKENKNSLVPTRNARGTEKGNSRKGGQNSRDVKEKKNSKGKSNAQNKKRVQRKTKRKLVGNRGKGRNSQTQKEKKPKHRKKQKERRAERKNTRKQKEKQEKRKNRKNQTKTSTKPKNGKKQKERRTKRRNNRKLKEKRTKTKNGRKEEKRGEKRRKGRKNKKVPGKGRSRKNIEKQDSDCTDACAQKFSEISKWRNGAYSNLEKQLKRTTAFVSLTDFKYVKRDVFNSAKDLLLRTLGGDTNNPICVNQPAFPADIAHLRTLEQCEANLTVTCQPLFTQADDALWARCSTTRSTMSQLLLNLEDKFTCSDVCPAADAIQFAGVNQCIRDINATKIKIENHWKKECNTAFLECRKAERAVADIVDRCKKCPDPIVINITTAQIQLTVLLQLNTALINIQNTFGAALLTIGITGIPACTIPVGKTALMRREKRQSFESENPRCLSLLDDWKSFNSSAEAAAESGADPLDVDAARRALPPLYAISNRSDVEGDLRSCQQKQNERQAPCSLAINYISVYYFWAVYWNTVVVQVKITIITILFPTLLPTTTTVNPSIVTCVSALTTAAPTVTTESDTTPCLQVTTTAPNMGRRWKLMKEMNRFERA